MTALNMKRYSGENAGPIGERCKDDGEPVQVITREVSVAVRDRKVEIAFSRGGPPIKIGSRAEFEKILASIARGTYEYPCSKPENKPNLSIGNTEKSYIVISLTGDLDWQFVRDAAPFSLAPDADPAFYREAARVDAKGTIIPTRDYCGEILVQDGCRTAYFVADGAAAVSRNGKYIHHYNINVVVEAQDADGNRILQPLVIDPDIRHPGVKML